MKLSKNGKNKKVYIIISIIIITLGIVTGGYFFFFKKTAPPVSTTQTGQKVISDPNVPGGQEKGSVSQGVTSDKSGNVPNSSAPSATTKPATPIGVFVSNHHPNLSNTPAPNSLTSTCTTTPGVECKIQFTKDSTTKELPAAKADGNGNTEWNWTLQQVGLTQGTWKVAAVATNGSLTTTSNDAMDLEVQP